jgi:hypothetical protein
MTPTIVPRGELAPLPSLSVVADTVEGARVGRTVGAAVGPRVGSAVGNRDGTAVGAAVGDTVGVTVGVLVGAVVHIAHPHTSDPATKIPTGMDVPPHPTPPLNAVALITTPVGRRMVRRPLAANENAPIDRTPVMP